MGELLYVFTSVRNHMTRNVSKGKRYVTDNIFRIPPFNVTKQTREISTVNQKY